MNRCAAAGVLALLASMAAAQNPPPDFTAPPGSAQATPSPVYTAPRPADRDQIVKDVVDLYRRTCLTSVGEAGALVDAALASGLQPYLGGPEGDVNTGSLLGDVPGQVYASPGSSDLLLAIGDDGLCTVWAEHTEGPRLKAAFVAAMAAMRERGTSVRAVRDRTIRRAGGWRQQIGYDVSDARRSFSADAVTLLTPQPGVQVLRAAPLGARAPVAGASRPVPENAALN